MTFKITRCARLTFAVGLCALLSVFGVLPNVASANDGALVVAQKSTVAEEELTPEERRRRRQERRRRRKLAQEGATSEAIQTETQQTQPKEAAPSTARPLTRKQLRARQKRARRLLRERQKKARQQLKARRKQQLDANRRRAKQLRRAQERARQRQKRAITERTRPVQRAPEAKTIELNPNSPEARRLRRAQRGVTLRQRRLRNLRRRLDRKRRQKVAAQNQNLAIIRKQRRRRRVGGNYVIEEPDNRRIVRRGRRMIIRGNDSLRLRRRARNVAERRRGDVLYTTVTRPNGVQIITVRDRNGRLLRRVRRGRNGRERVLINNYYYGGRRYRDDDSHLFLAIAAPIVAIAAAKYIVDASHASRHDMYDAFAAPPVRRLPRRYTLDQIRYNEPLRAHMRSLNLTMVNFSSGSWYIDPEGYESLEDVADAMHRVIARNPDEIFLVEGHTDAVGSDYDNLSLSDRRAEAVAVALTEDFDIPSENLVTQGYGEQHLYIKTQYSERRNRRVVIRRITPLLSQEDGPDDLAYDDY